MLFEIYVKDLETANSSGFFHALNQTLVFQGFFGSVARTVARSLAHGVCRLPRDGFEDTTVPDEPTTIPVTDVCARSLKMATWFPPKRRIWKPGAQIDEIKRKAKNKPSHI